MKSCVTPTMGTLARHHLVARRPGRHDSNDVNDESRLVRHLSLPFLPFPPLASTVRLISPVSPKRTQFLYLQTHLHSLLAQVSVCPSPPTSFAPRFLRDQTVLSVQLPPRIHPQLTSLSNADLSIVGTGSAIDPAELAARRQSQGAVGRPSLKASLVRFGLSSGRALSTLSLVLCPTSNSSAVTTTFHKLVEEVETSEDTAKLLLELANHHLSVGTLNQGVGESQGKPWANRVQAKPN